ncbi:MAG: transposase [Mesorhizobium sp.]|nr:MAG: IS4/IS5 family transposase [Mesorhizobium sp.]RWJ34571.1 MAG: IS4/IS5 family transposase [Mesorhizobium sp.]TIQ16935.1 MAG: transposase [Mesorhizobium sp.]TIQ70872.1 MAG: transposase [Mesorhizobium sp.]
MTCWRRTSVWQDAGTWDLIPSPHARPTQSGRRDRLVQSLGGFLIHRGQKGGRHDRPEPDRSRQAGPKRHILVDRTGIPLAVVLTGANIHDSTALTAVVDAVRPVRQRRGRSRTRPDKLHADKGYDFDRRRNDLRARGITPRIARRGFDSSKHLGKHRWGGRANLRMDQPVPSPHHPLRAPCRPLSRLSRPRRRPHMLSNAQDPVLLGVLRSKAAAAILGGRINASTRF